MANKHQQPQSQRGCLIAFIIGIFIVVVLAGVIDTCASPRKPGDPISTVLVWAFLLTSLYVLINTKFKKDENWFE
ncbi:hypothetical protein [Flavisolibacter nicotianae]|uniref:hypothetical protein n=1 Tax=Flavisolibacter nicotianae TaxID=2364882 RepID=UPI000EAF3E34|nr:hypothetical protein [Flavisolibacter nicotianae]